MSILRKHSTLILGLITALCFVYGAIIGFEADPSVLLEFFIMTLVLVFLIFLAAVTAVFLKSAVKKALKVTLLYLKRFASCDQSLKSDFDHCDSKD